MVGVDWMRCAHEDCEQLIIRIHESRVKGWVDGSAVPVSERLVWTARPRFGESKRQIAAEVPEPSGPTIWRQLRCSTLARECQRRCRGASLPTCWRSTSESRTTA